MPETRPCRYCNRTLKDPVSVRVGFGPTCGKKHGLAAKVQVSKTEKRQDVTQNYGKPEDYFTGQVVLVSTDEEE